MADFLTAYNNTARNEGLYANNPADHGGETYSGISRKSWPNWKGWAIIDAIKREHGTTVGIINKFAGSNQTLNTLLQEFYKVNFWYPINLQLINDQQLANNVYDFAVNAGVVTSAKRLQMAANAVCGSLTIDGKVGSLTVAAINKLSGRAVFDAFNTLRKTYYDNIIAKDPSQKVFQKTWYSRIVPYKNIT